MLAPRFSYTQIEPMSLRERVTIEISKHFFWYFLEHVYLKSSEGQTYTNDNGEQQPYAFAAVHREWAMLMQYNYRTCIMAPRYHLKSELAKAFCLWQLFRVGEGELMDGLYLSYKNTLAQEQLEKLLRVIRFNPYCRFWRNLKPAATSTVNFMIDFGEGTVGEGMIRADGILAASRGRHPHFVICDDILPDSKEALSSAEITRINRVFRQSIMSLPANPDDYLIVTGTPQSHDDILHLLASNPEWLWLRYPAIQDEAQGLTLWPEKYPMDRLKRVRTDVGRTAFQVEFMLVPVQVEQQFFATDDILRVTDPELQVRDLLDVLDTQGLGTYGGFDVGRKVHPSHVTVLLELPSGTLVQVFMRFLDQYNYNTQVDILNRVAEVFNLDRGYYDATYNALEDRGLDPVWRGRSFNRKLKADMATGLEKRVFARPDQPGIILLPDTRQLHQITLVDKTLSAATTVEGHGDAFWSLGLAVRAADDGPSIIDIGSATPISRLRPRAPGWLHQLAPSG